MDRKRTLAIAIVLICALLTGCSDAQKQLSDEILIKLGDKVPEDTEPLEILEEPLDAEPPEETEALPAVDDTPADAPDISPQPPSEPTQGESSQEALNTAPAPSLGADEEPPIEATPDPTDIPESTDIPDLTETPEPIDIPTPTEEPEPTPAPAPEPAPE